MQAHDFRRLLGLVDTLDVEQCAQLKLHLMAGDGVLSLRKSVGGGESGSGVVSAE